MVLRTLKVRPSSSPPSRSPSPRKRDRIRIVLRDRDLKTESDNTALVEMASSSSNVDPGAETASERLRQLKDFANDFNMDRRQPIRRFYHSGHQMLRMGDTYYKEASLEKAYVLYLKFLTLFVEQVPSHPEYKSLSAIERNKMRPHLKTALIRCEDLKVKLNHVYDGEHDVWKVKEAERRRLEDERKAKLREIEGAKIRAQLGQYQEEKDRTIATQQDYEAALLNQLQWDKEQEKTDMEEAIKRSQDMAITTDDQQLPSVDRSVKPSAPSMEPSGMPSVPDRSNKPALRKITSGGLRELIIPQEVMSQFLRIAEVNTVRNVETCAILGGELARDVFTITHVLVPKQKGTADSCTMTNDDEMFEYQLSNDLLTLGWIHTHPSQTAFLSSVDLHNHYGYQVMLPEAVAIVCAPKYQETGFFVLTSNHGMEFIGNCNEKGFHPHPAEPPLFEEGCHITVDAAKRVKLVDLR